MAHQHFTRTDRVFLQQLRTSGLSVASCARILRKHRSSIYRELKRGAENTSSGYSIRASRARSKRLRRQANQQHRKLNEHLALRIVELLKLYWSPEQIASAVGLSHSTIYRWLWSQPKAFISEMLQYLRHPKARRKYGSKRRQKQRELSKKRWIDQRPRSIDRREDYGHWEGDTVVGKNRSGYLVTLVERKSGYALTGHIPDKSMVTFRRCTERLLEPLPSCLKRSITLDNGTEMNDYEVLENNTGIPIYFAHPYHSWERGCNENFNGLLRQFYPKSRELREVDQAGLDHALRLINTRPRKRHGYKSPDALLKLDLGVAI